MYSCGIIDVSHLSLYYTHVFFFFFKQKTAYEMRISDWSSDVCSSDLRFLDQGGDPVKRQPLNGERGEVQDQDRAVAVVAQDPEIGGDPFQDVPIGGRQIGRASCRERVCQYV